MRHFTMYIAKADVSEKLWERAQQVAKVNGTTIGPMVADLLRQLVAKQPMHCGAFLNKTWTHCPKCGSKI